MGMKTYLWDGAERLDSEEAIKSYIEVVLDDVRESGDDFLLGSTLGHIAKARGMALIASEIGTTAQQLFDALSGQDENGRETLVRALESIAEICRARLDTGSGTTSATRGGPEAA